MSPFKRVPSISLLDRSTHPDLKYYRFLGGFVRCLYLLCSSCTCLRFGRYRRFLCSAKAASPKFKLLLSNKRYYPNSAPFMSQAICSSSFQRVPSISLLGGSNYPDLSYYRAVGAIIVLFSTLLAVIFQSVSSSFFLEGTFHFFPWWKQPTGQQILLPCRR